MELAGAGAAPFAAMLLADLGAEVVRIDRPRQQAIQDTAPGAPPDPALRGRRSVAVDLKHPAGVETVLRLADRADALVEGFRPGVAERLGIGPDVCMSRNQVLVYGRVTGWGRDGPLSRRAGHDVNFIGLAGVLDAIGRAGGPPVPPLNLVGDLGGGGLLAAFGVVCALLEAASSGRGQVVDLAMVDGAALLMTFVSGLRADGAWTDARGSNIIDSGAPFYEVYECADGRFICVGELEPAAHRELCQRLGIDDPGSEAWSDRTRWPELKSTMAAVIRTRTRKEWSSVFHGTDSCVAPVLSLPESAEHPQLRHRATFVEFGGVIHPAPAPRFSRTPGQIGRPPARPGEHTDEVLAELGMSQREVRSLHDVGAVRQWTPDEEE